MLPRCSIVGLPRSGTSILYRTIQQHPSSRPSRVELTESKITASANRSHPLEEPVGKDGLPRHYMLFDEPAYAAFLMDVRRWRDLHRRLNVFLGPRSARAMAKPVAGWLACGNHAVLRASDRHAMRARGVQRLVERTPTNLPHARKLMRAFPDARLVCMCVTRSTRLRRTGGARSATTRPG